jgi:hypothetical protein
LGAILGGITLQRLRLLFFLRQPLLCGSQHIGRPALFFFSHPDRSLQAVPAVFHDGLHSLTVVQLP